MQGRPPRMSGRREIRLPISVTVAIVFKYTAILVSGSPDGPEAYAAFAGAARDGMLDAIAGEDFQASVIQLDGDVDRELLGGSAQDFAQAVIHIEAARGLVKAGFRGQPGVLLLFERQRGSCQK